MKFGEVEMFSSESGETPVLLLDDVMSELDEVRQRQLVELTAGIQTILTCTEFRLNMNCRRILIEDGRAADGD